MKRIIVIVSVLAIVVSVSAGTARAGIPHEDPALATQIFSGISLLQYYSDSLDLVIEKDPQATEMRLQKMPFVNIPPELAAPTTQFANSGIELSRLVADLSKAWEHQRILLGQFRFGEIVSKSAEISDRAAQAETALNRLERAVQATGTYLRISSLPLDSGERRTYNEALGKLRRIRDMLDTFRRPLFDKDKVVGFKPTTLTLEIRPLAAFVGDELSFEGILSSEGKPLEERAIEILLNGSKYAIAMTDSLGHYSGRLELPYWYVTKLEVQALYYPRDKDVGLYLAAPSPTINLSLQFYESKLEVKVDNLAYPGREIILVGGFDYGGSPLPRNREAMVYLDDILATRFMTQQTFNQALMIDSRIALGKHTVTVSVPGHQRYSPAVVSAILEIVRATPILDLDAPSIAFIPGVIALKGKLYSDVGPLKAASIAVGVNKSEVMATTSPEGLFEAKLRMGLGLSLVGTQTLNIQVRPGEPWHASLITTGSVFMINTVNSAIILAIVIVFGFYVPRKFQKWYKVYPGRIQRAVGKPPPGPVLAARDVAAAPARPGNTFDQVPLTDRRLDESSNPILYWYRFILNLIQKITRKISHPQQTLREYARENSQTLGPASKYFVELTLLVERQLYAAYKPTEEDAAKSRQLSEAIEEEVKRENI